MISETLGNVELKHVSYGDSKEFAKILQEKLQDKDFVTKILFHQLIKPKISFDDFNKLSNVEIESLAREFVKNEDHTFKYFQDTGNYFKDFKQALATGHEKHIEELRKTFEPIVKSAQETLTTFSKNYASVIQQAIDGTSYIQESMRGLAEVAKQIGDTQRRFIESIKPAIEQYQSTAKIIAESLRPQIDFWQKWAEQNKRVFDNFSSYWTEFQQKYNIAEQKAVQVLQKYKWFITPSFPILFIFEVVKLDKKKGRQDKTVNSLFVKFFEAKNWRNLETMVNDWKNKPLLKKRYKILIDCVETVKLTSKKGINEANVILPTLITQIDGALTDYLNSKGIQWDCDYDDWIDGKTGKVKKIGRKTQFKNSKTKVLTTQLDDLANDIFLNILFQKSQKGKPLVTPFNFNRHKIIHGESIKYGRKDYLIRAFMVLDLLAHF
ncbi:MAG: hypothetical protein NT116_05375 [Candidatus Parcubacteria bacterium]|nr:hypothetical protein [Candidatus Parcubacteria bacterium]